MASSRKRKAKIEPKVESETGMESDLEMDIDSEEFEEATAMKTETTNIGVIAHKPAKRIIVDSETRFVGQPIPLDEALELYPRRYKNKSKYENSERKGKEKEERDDGDEQEDWQAKCHYRQAEIDGVIYNLDDNAYVKPEEGQADYIARIVEFFEGVDGNLYYKALWYYRPQDTVIEDLLEYSKMFDCKRVFLSEMKNTNELDSILSKVNIIKVSPDLDPEALTMAVANCDLYYNMKYLLPNHTFSNPDDEDDKKINGEALSRQDSDPESTLSSDTSPSVVGKENCSTTVPEKPKMNLLDLYSGCGAMSTGLCMGASLSGLNIVTKWAVDFNQYACESLKLNHPEAEVRNEPAEDFLELMKGWQNLCNEFNVSEAEQEDDVKEENVEEEEEEEDENEEVYEVEKLLGVCYGDPNKKEKKEKTEKDENKKLHFKVRWKGYDDSEDTWEPIEGLSTCKDKLKQFVREGYKNKIIPLPGDVDFICGGPPCQGISGFNRFRKAKTPFEDPKNYQAHVYFDIIQFLKPRYTLMENVVDLLKFSGGLLGRYAIGRLVAMDYQCRIGRLVAGCYGVPQYRCRVFLWGAHHSEKLPPYPLPTHRVSQNRGNLSKAFEEIIVGYGSPEEIEQLHRPLCLEDAISDLPPVANDEKRDEIPYGNKSDYKFHEFISLPKHKVVGFENTAPVEAKLFDHRPLNLNQDDFERVQQIPKKKGANFRDLAGVKVGDDKKVYLDPDVTRPLVTSGKPLVPDYAISFIDGKSLKPFGRLWYDEIISTVVTRAEPHNQIIIHPEQDRVLTIRELARLQGFPDFYKLRGPVKERYKQVGNAVAVPVGTALGYALGLAAQGLCSSEPTVKIPFKFPDCLRSSLHS